MADSDPKVLCCGDVLAVVYRADKDGKIRVQSHSMHEDAKTLGPDVVLVALWRENKIVVEVHPSTILGKVSKDPVVDSPAGGSEAHGL